MEPRTLVLITGGAGLLGRALIRTTPPGVELHATRRSTPVTGAEAHTVELSDAEAVATLWARLRPSLVVHTAYSMQEGERDIWAATVNVVAACLATGAALLYLSTDAPYGESDEPNPVYEYGRWKARAEHIVQDRMPDAAVIRTSLIVEFEPLDVRSGWIANALRQGETITLFVDELRCPIVATDLAQQLWELAALPRLERSGVWHLAGPEALSRYTLGLLVAAHEGLDPSGITPGVSAGLPSPRPRDIRLLTSRADRVLTTRPRPISALLAAAALNP